MVKKQKLEKQEVVSQEEFNKLQDDFSNLENQLKRAVADYQNLEKRISEGRSELAAWATSDVIRKLLPVMDHFEKALGSASEAERQSGWFRGVELAVIQLRGVLKNEGLEEIVADGQFDPALHEAVDTRDGENDKIMEVVERGYKLNGKIIKPARVVVGRTGSN